MMLTYGIPLTERYKKSFIGRFPAWAWMIVFFLLSIGSGFFMTQASINSLAYSLLGSASGAAEAGNLMWAHLLFGLISVLIFELVAWLYHQIVTMSARGSLSIAKAEFAGIFRAFYCLFLVITGLFQGLYYVNTLIVLYGSALISLVARFIVILLFFLYLKKHYFNDYTAPKATLAIFLPYVIYEVVSLIWSLI